MKQDKRKTDTKEKIFDVAIDLFSKRGIDATSIRDISSNVGITPASFYNHFESKDSLLQSMYDYYQRKLVKPAAKRIDYKKMIKQYGVIDFFKVLNEMVFKIETDEKLEKLGRIIAMEQYKNTTAAGIAYNNRKSFMGIIKEIMIEMTNIGMIKTDNPEMMAAFLGYIYAGISMDYYYKRFCKEKKITQIVDELNTVISHFLHDVLGCS